MRMDTRLLDNFHIFKTLSSMFNTKIFDFDYLFLDGGQIISSKLTQVQMNSTVKLEMETLTTPTLADPRP